MARLVDALCAASMPPAVTATHGCTLDGSPEGPHPASAEIPGGPPLLVHGSRRLDSWAELPGQPHPDQRWGHPSDESAMCSWRYPRLSAVALLTCSISVHNHELYVHVSSSTREGGNEMLLMYAAAPNSSPGPDKRFTIHTEKETRDQKRQQSERRLHAMCQGLMNTVHQLSHHHHDPHHDHDDEHHPHIIIITTTNHQQPRPSAPATIPPFATLLHRRPP